MHDQENVTLNMDENVLRATVYSWITIQEPREQRGFLQEHLDLLTPRSDVILHKFIEALQVSEDTEEHQQVWLLRNFLNILIDVRARGGTSRAVLEAYINAGGGFACNLPSWLQAMKEYGEAQDVRGQSQQKALQRIERLQAALQRVTDELIHPPEIRAELLTLLGQAQADVQLQRQLSLDNALLFYEAALKIYMKARYPYQYARIQVELGLAYSQVTTQERASALERSISCYEEAAQILSCEKYPMQWANIQNNLGEIYRMRQVGEQRQNIERAIACYQATLALPTQEFPLTIWATAQLNLGVAYLARIEGSKQENLDLAIKHHEAALQVFTRETNPGRWVIIQSNLGECYRKRITGQKSENLEKAILCLETALQVCKREAYPLDWARLQSNLGLIDGERQQGDPAKNLQQAIACQEAALQVYTRKAFPFEWARIQLNMGKIYADRKGVWIEPAITCYQASLEIYTPETTFERWQLVQIAMATAYIERSSGVREDNLRRTRACYETWLRTMMTHTQPPGHPYFALLTTCLRILAPPDAGLEELERLLPLYQHVIERLPIYELDWVRVFHMLASFLLDRFEESWHQEDPERAIALLEAIVQVLSDAEPMRFLIYDDLSRALFLRWTYKKHLDDLEQTITRVRQTLQAIPAHDTSFLVSSQRRLGNALLSRYTITGQPDDLEQSIASFADALQIAPESAVLLANTSSALLNRYARTEQLTDLEHARQYILFALEHTATDAPERAHYLSTASNCLVASYTRTGDLQELEGAITYCGEAIQRAAVDAPDLPLYVSTLSHLLNMRYERTGRLEDLEQGIEFCRASMGRFLPGSPMQWGVHYYLASALLLRYGQTGNAEDAEEAIGLCRSVLPQIQPNSPLRAALLDKMSAALTVRSSYNDHQENLEEALAANREAIACTPPDAPDLPLYLTHLGTSLMARYAYSGDLEDLRQATDTFTRALERIQPDSPALPATVANLGMALQILYQHIGKQELLEMALYRNREAVQLASRNLAALPQYLMFLGTALSLSYAHTGRYEQLEEMLGVFERALTLVSATSPTASLITIQMGNALFARHLRTGSLEDLEQTITMLQKQLRDLPPTSSLRPALLNVLAMSWREHFERTNNNLEDLEQALMCLQQANEQLPADSPLEPRLLDSLGAVLITRYQHTNDFQDLEMGIRVLNQSFLKTPVTSPHWLPIAGNVGSALYYYYQHNRDQESLERSIEICREAVKLAPVGSPSRPLLLKLLACNLLLHFELTQFAQEHEEYITLFEQACQEGLLQDPDLALSAGREWGNYAWDQGQWEEAARAYSYALEAFELLYREQLSLLNKQTRLQHALSLYERAAYAHCKIGKLREAVMILEQGKARGLNDALARDHANLERVAQLQPEIYQRYIQAAEYVRLLEQGGQSSVDLLQNEQQPIPTQQLQPLQLRLARAELDAAIEAIRQLPGYQEFLTRPTYEQLAQAAVVDVPLVYIAVTPANSIALLLRAESTQPELLEVDFSFDQQTQMFFKNDSDGKPEGGYLWGLLGENQLWLEEALREALPILGRTLLAPLALRLRELNATGVVLITAGMLGVWPLHAARYLRGEQEIFLGDEYAVAYTPSARALLAARQLAHQRQATEHNIHFVGVGNPQSGRAGALAAQRELRRLFPLLKHEIDKKLAHLTPTSEDLSELQESTELLEKYVREIQQLYQQEPERLQLADLRLLVKIFTTLEASKEVVTALKRLAVSLMPDLTSAQGEVESICHLFPSEATTVFYAEDAKSANILPILPQATHAHFACHGFFDAKEPLESALLLAGGTRLTMRDLFNSDAALLQHVQLVVLSACQTAVSDFLDMPNEALALLAGFLQAGTPAVIGTLWSVGDSSTALLMTRFYTLYLLGDQEQELAPGQPVRALALAQRWLRELTYAQLQNLLATQQGSAQTTLSASLQLALRSRVRQAMRKNRLHERPFADPYYWAAFVYYGA